MIRPYLAALARHCKYVEDNVTELSQLRVLRNSVLSEPAAEAEEFPEWDRAELVRRFKYLQASHDVPRVQDIARIHELEQALAVAAPLFEAAARCDPSFGYATLVRAAQDRATSVAGQAWRKARGT